MAAQNLPAKVLSELDPVKLAQVEAETAAHNAQDNMQPSLAQAENGGRKPRFVRTSWRERVEHARVTPLQIVRDVLPASGVACIYGDSTAGKTFLAVDLVGKIATAKEEGGTEWFSHPVSRRPVTYLCLEGGLGFDRRIWAYTQTFGPLDGIDFINGQLFNIMDDEDVNDLIVGTPKGSVVVIDTLAQAAPGIDENAGKDMSRLLSAANRISQEVEGLVLLIAHSGKDGAKGVRGWSGQRGAFDAVIEVSRNGAVRSWKIDKLKDGADGAVSGFTLEEVMLLNDDGSQFVDGYGKPISSCVVEPSDLPTGAVTGRALSESGNMGLDAFTRAAQESSVGYVTDAAWRAKFYERVIPPDPEKADDYKRQRYHRAKKELVQKGVLFKNKDDTLFSRIPFSDMETE